MNSHLRMPERSIRLLVLLMVGFLFWSGCDGDGSDDNGLPPQAELTHLPCTPAEILWMQPFGQVDHGGGNAFFHNGIDFGTTTNGHFFSCGDGVVTQVDLDTGVGWPGTNYRITIQVASDTFLDYHFEIGGSVSEDQRRNNVLVTVGQTVAAGQPIGNLIVLDSDISHVHWSVFEGGAAVSCPLIYFTVPTTQNFEALYDSGIEKRPANRPHLCP